MGRAAGRRMRSERDFSAEALTRYATRVEHQLRYDMALARLIVQLIPTAA